jgi:energy-coupling factor transporter ATP-binding protein EcfA2
LLIIVEGADGVGKSTLVDHLVEAIPSSTDLKVLRARPPRGHPLDEYVMPLLDYRPIFSRTNPSVICDRWHLGELVYPTVLDRPTRMSTTVFRYVEMFLASRGAIVVHVSDDPDELESVLWRRGDDLVRPEQAKQMIDLFFEAMSRSALPVIDLEARDSSAETVDAVLGLAKKHESLTTRLHRFVTYVGPLRPRYLLVGDVRGGNPFTHGRKPAFMPYSNSCGDYLLRAIASTFSPDERDRRLAEIGIINANDVDDFRSAWHTFGQPNVVPLGMNAARKVADYGISPVAYAPHPQYQKRFHYHEHEEYGKMITGSWES